MPDPADLSLDETRAFLTEQAHKKFGKVPTELIVRQVFAITEGADFPVRRAALEAIERRMDNAERDGLHVVESPEGTPWGDYQVAKMAEQGEGRRRRERRPYVTTLNALDPLSVSCNCQDYLKGSLGLCEHVLAVLEHWHSTPKRLAQLQRSPVPVLNPNHPRLVWDPVWPLRGDEGSPDGGTCLS